MQIVMDIVINIDNNFIAQAEVLCASVFENGCEGISAGECTIHVLSNAVSEENRKELSGFVCAFGGTCRFYELGDLAASLKERMGAEAETGKFRVTVLARLFAAELLPKTVERFLYLDSDMIVRHSLLPLFETGLDRTASEKPAKPEAAKEGRLAAVCAEPTIYRDISEGPYFNSGMMLIDRGRWMEEKITDRCMEYYRKKNGTLSFVDQDILNAVLSGKVKFVSQRWNFFTNYVYESFRSLAGRAPWYEAVCRGAAGIPAEVSAAEGKAAAEKEYEEARRDPAVVHFAGDERPWFSGNKNPYRAEYEKYLGMTPHKDDAPVKGKEAYMAFYHMVNVLSAKIPGFRKLASFVYRKTRH